MYYRFEVDSKQTVWNRDIVYIEANSPEEAETLMLEAYETGDYIELIDYSEPLYDTAEMLHPIDNNGISTVEITDEKGTIIYENGQPNI